MPLDVRVNFICDRCRVATRSVSKSIPSRWAKIETDLQFTQYLCPECWSTNRQWIDDGAGRLFGTRADMEEADARDEVEEEPEEPGEVREAEGEVPEGRVEREGSEGEGGEDLEQSDLIECPVKGCEHTASSIAVLRGHLISPAHDLSYDTAMAMADGQVRRRLIADATYVFCSFLRCDANFRFIDDLRVHLRTAHDLDANTAAIVARALFQ